FCYFRMFSENAPENSKGHPVRAAFVTASVSCCARSPGSVCDPSAAPAAVRHSRASSLRRGDPSLLTQSRPRSLSLLYFTHLGQESHWRGALQDALHPPARTDKVTG